MRLLYVSLAALALLTAGCATTSRVLTASPGGRNQDLPEQAMRELAAQIEDTVSRGDREARIGDYKGIAVTTPGMVQAIRTRAARREILDAFLDTGHAWERADGMIHIRRSQAYKQTGNRRSRDRDALIVMGENRDRWALYEGLVDANHFGGNALQSIKSIFADARVITLKPGHKYETAEGEVAIR